MHFSLVYKGLICLDLKEKNRKQMCIFNPEFRKNQMQEYIQSSEKKRNSWLRKKLRSFKNSSYL